jgi:hypothetical protein
VLSGPGTPRCLYSSPSQTPLATGFPSSISNFISLGLLPLSFG